MPRQSTDSVKGELQEEQKDIYGDEAPGGHMAGSEDFEEADKPLEEFVGNEVSGLMNIEKEIEQDEVDIAGLPLSTDPKAEFENEPDKDLERVENAVHQDYLEDEPEDKGKNG